MNKTQVKGTINEFVGSAKRKTGELTGNKTLQVKGIIQQTKGQVENTLGKAKESLRDVINDTKAHLNAHVKLAARNSTATANVRTTKIAPNSKSAIRTA
jgi:uncharacterized protein YjbJ (UPF0337 family)